MKSRIVTFVGALILVHRDEPDEREIRRRVRRVLDAGVRGGRVIEVGPGLVRSAHRRNAGIDGRSHPAVPMSPRTARISSA
jgi:hypothetical protein